MAETTTNETSVSLELNNSSSTSDVFSLTTLNPTLVPSSSGTSQPPPPQGSPTTTTITTAPNDGSNSMISSSSQPQRLHIAGLYDTRSAPRGSLEHLMKFTIHLLNNHTNGWHDDVLASDDSAQLEFSISDSACDADIAVRAYLKLMRGDHALEANMVHAIYGCRCSGASMAVARLAGIENIPMLSSTSTSTKLSNKQDYSTFSRLASPDNHKGQVGALIRLFQSLQWNRISVITTDTQFTKDIALELSDAWTGRRFQGADGGNFHGEIAFTDTIKLDATTNEVDEGSVQRVLKAVPVENPAINSRIIVLFAHHQHAFPILQVAAQMKFQPDTIWVGTSEWADYKPLDKNTSWMPPVPGYIGVTPYRNKESPIYLDFLGRLQEYERQRKLPITSDLYDHVADRTVDAVVTLTKAFSALPPDLRHDGWLVSRELRKLNFEGLSGQIAFDDNGDLVDEKFAVVNMASGASDESLLHWNTIGYVTPNTVEIDEQEICFAQVGCAVTVIPGDEYPPAKEPLPFWIWIVLAILVIVLALFYQQQRKTRTVTEKLRKIEEELETLDSNDDAVKQRKCRLYQETAALLGQPMPAHWTNRQGLVEVQPHEQEYWTVQDRLRATMNTTTSDDNDNNDDSTNMCHLSKLSRIQNVGIWSYYVFRKNQLANKYGTDLTDKELVKEVSVWHGTSSLNPDIIYNDQQDGFMMQLSQQGHWGRGIYFSERSGYSDPYSFRPFTDYSSSEQPDRELFLVQLLVGETIFLDRNEGGDWMMEACRNLVTPPDNPNRNGFKFDSVTGRVDDEKKTKVYVVYENGRAYPEYLVRYYKGERDPSRTPFCSIEEALVAKALLEKEQQSAHQQATEQNSSSFWGSARSFLTTNTTNNKVDNGDSDDGLPKSDDVQDSITSVISDLERAPPGVWQFEDGNGGWENYLDGHQVQLEQAYQRDPTGVTTIEQFPWTYAVDFSVNVQTNLDHPDKTSRKVRRIIADDV